MLIFLLVLATPPLLAAAWWWWADRRIRHLPGSAWWRTAVGGLSLIFLVFFGWLVFGRLMGLGGSIHPWVLAYMMLWGLIFLPMMALPLMGMWGVWRGGCWFRERTVRWWQGAGRANPNPTSNDPTPGNPSERMTRRQMIEASMVALPLAGALGSTVWSIPQKRQFQVTEYSLWFKKLPAALDGMRIAHVSDTHVGKFTRGPVLDRITDAVNDLAADLVLVTGDLIDHSVIDLPEAIAMLDRIDPRSGLLMVEGNHDLFDGRDAFRQPLRRHGVGLLVDESRTVRVRGVSVRIMGIAWHTRGGQVAQHVDRVAALGDPDDFSILLAHHPDAFDGAVKHGIDLTLAGHTHGGQLMLSDGFGAGPMMFNYWSGLYRKAESQLVVSNGTGNWFPLRVNAPAEVVHLTLRRG